MDRSASKAREARSTAIFVGESTLLVRCAEAFLLAGHGVAAVVTSDDGIAQWAEKAGLTALPKDQALAERLGGVVADYLFSVGNLAMLPGSVISVPRVAAINFHDAPLPSYAGLNAAAWAVYEGEERHGVSWHEMTAVPDGGRLVASETITIEPGDTALSVNTKCYEAGFASFCTIITAIEAGGLSYREQIGTRRYFGRHKRPSAAATLDLRQPAEILARITRALQFGPYVNPLGRAKLMLEHGIAIAGDAECVPGAGEPGQVLARCGDSVTVMTGAGALRLSGLLGVPGGALAVGDVLPMLSTRLVEEIDRLNAAAARSETRWLHRMAQADAVELPYPRKPQAAARQFDIASSHGSDAMLAAIAAWALRVCGVERVSLAISSDAHDAVLGNAARWFCARRPLTIEAAGTLGGLTETVTAARRDLEALGPLACDLRLRQPPGAALMDAEALPIAVHIGKGGPTGMAAIAIAIHEDGQGLRLRVSGHDDVVAREIAAQIEAALDAAPAESIATLDLRSHAQRTLFAALDTGNAHPVPKISLHDSIAHQAMATPQRVAVQTRRESLTYAALDARSDRAAARLAALGARPGMVVGICMERCADLVTAMLAVLKTGAAYLPLDPTYPADRIGFMLGDSRAALVVCTPEAARTHRFGHARSVPIADLVAEAGDIPAFDKPPFSERDLAYLIYTSGSTGRPKGVMLPHGAVQSFFTGMDSRVPHDGDGRWLAVTSPNFDISVLELLWTLARGFTVALHIPRIAAPGAAAPSFSLFYFGGAADADDPYRLLMEGAEFADRNGFEAVWTPERHFHNFGGAFPNPAVTGAAVAAATTRIAIRAGSCVLPLHHPIRVAEDWSVIDNISGGRVGIAFAAGWQPHDFVLSPADYRDRKAVMLARMEEVRRLWRGEAVSFADPNGAAMPTRTLPRPIQAELPVWLTAAKNPETFEIAGRAGHNVLTHLLGMSVEEVGRSIRTYRDAWRAAGHPGEGRVTLMLHSFVGESDNAVRATVRGPMKRYLGAALDLVRDASWSFPTIVERAQQSGRTPAEVFEQEPLTADELDALLDHAFDRYFSTSGLFGTLDTCLRMVERVAAVGVDEIACLVDYGVPTDTVLAQLPLLRDVMEHASAGMRRAEHFSVADDLAHFRATHLQCTPSMAAMIVEDQRAVPELRAVLVGGEALSVALARKLRAYAPSASLLNMYGPTETCIWSTTAVIEAPGDSIPLGRPIANTVLRIVNAAGTPQPAYVPGELLIGGAGVALGYWERPDLTRERFVRLDDGTPAYRTGDLVRRDAAGTLEFLGRIDHQVKLRGHRIELGEVEAVLEQDEAVAQAAVTIRPDAAGEPRLVAYVTERALLHFDEADCRARMAASLPEIMLPSIIMRLPSMPLTPNGKIDRAALPAPAQATTSAPVEAPRKGLEQRISVVWSELLGLDSVGLRQNFFDLGGHSLLAVQMQRRLRAELARDIAITDIFRFPTIHDLAAHLGGGQREDAAVDVGQDRAKARLAARRRSVVAAGIDDDDV
ncbi:MAG: ATP-dependent AMP-binding enzyme family protein [Rhodospirillales bacterium]|nr:ATP-dependent AMP-binding enzyme family protein [Rhodospirillales bacterium]